MFVTAPENLGYTYEVEWPGKLCSLDTSSPFIFFLIISLSLDINSNFTNNICCLCKGLYLLSCITFQMFVWDLVQLLVRNCFSTRFSILGEVHIWILTLQNVLIPRSNSFINSLERMQVLTNQVAGERSRTDFRVEQDRLNLLTFLNNYQTRFELVLLPSSVNDKCCVSV